MTLPRCRWASQYRYSISQSQELRKNNNNKKDKKAKLVVQLLEKHWDSQTEASVIPSGLGREISCHEELLREK